VCTASPSSSLVPPHTQLLPSELTGSGSTRCSGRVEIFYNNTWGTVSDYNWDLKDAEVVCRQLDCGSALEVPQSVQFGAGTGQIWLSGVSCSGNESSLTECQHSGWGNYYNYYGHSYDVGVICSGDKTFLYGTYCIGHWFRVIRLIGSGSTRCSGRVEVYHNNSWGTVCDDGWGLNDAEVVCRQINCGTALQAPRSAYFGAGTGQIWLDDVTCSGNESSLTDCQHSGFGSNRCEHGQDAAVICSGIVTFEVRLYLNVFHVLCVLDLIRLAGSGSSRCSGRVEIFHNNVWGTVSDYNWDLNDAEVVCRQLNCGSALQAPRTAYFGNESSLTECHNSWGTVCDDGWDLNDAEVVCRQINCGTALEVPQSAHFGAGTGQIWLGDVTCSGNESSLTECQHSGFGSHTCEHGQDAAVICSGEIFF
uniref:SRCR domain-containing protein n=1 Tax=Maylandia zebra TaxID=106582 RepID=A0A3P9CY99_9CICH